MDNLDTTGGVDTVDTGTGDGGQETGAGAATGDPGKGEAGGARQAATAAETGGTGTSAATGDAGEGAKGAPESWVPDDWRERIAGDDEKFLQSLRRYQSFDNWVKANRSLAQQIKTGMLRATLPENPSDAEIAAFRKSWGIPDAPDGYGIDFPEGFEATEADKADLAAFVDAMHKAHTPPHIVKGAVEWWAGMQAKVRQELAEAAEQKTIENKAAVKAEWGKDFDRNVRLGNEDLVSVLGEDDARALMAETLADGTKLGDHPAFLKYIVGSALRVADDEALVVSTFDAGGKGLREQYDAALDLKFSDPKKYHSPEHQQHLLRLRQALDRQQAAKTRAA